MANKENVKVIILSAAEMRKCTSQNEVLHLLQKKGAPILGILCFKVEPGWVVKTEERSYGMEKKFTFTKVQ